MSLKKLLRKEYVDLLTSASSIRHYRNYFVKLVQPLKTLPMSLKKLFRQNYVDLNQPLETLYVTEETTS